MTVKEYFEQQGDANTETISGGIFNRAAWPSFHHWPEVESCAREVVAAHPDQPFLGDRTLGMLMGWTMNLYRRKHGENLPSGWYAAAKQLMAAEPVVGASPSVPVEEYCPVCAAFPEAKATHPHR